MVRYWFGWFGLDLGELVWIVCYWFACFCCLPRCAMFVLLLGLGGTDVIVGVVLLCGDLFCWLFSLLLVLY